MTTAITFSCQNDSGLCEHHLELRKPPIYDDDDDDTFIKVSRL